MQLPPKWPKWPQPGSRTTRTLFEERPSLRKLVVLVDAELLATYDDQETIPSSVLTGLLSHSYITLLRYRDEGPPPEAPQREYGPPAARQSVADGWVELSAARNGGARSVVGADASSVIRSAVLGDLSEFARQEINSSVYADLGPHEAAERRERDAIAFEVAQSINADLFITERPYLFATQMTMQGVTVCNPSEALAIVGLYLRSQKVFLNWRSADGTITLSMNRGLYYWVGTRELLPNAWLWFGACTQESRATNDETLFELGQSLLRRVQRAFEARDRFHRDFNLPQNNDTASTVLDALDSMLVSLMGAVDASARVAHIVLGLPGHSRNAGWQHDRQWLSQVTTAEPQLAALFNVGTSHNHALTILRLMRNTVHGQMIRPIALRQPGRALETATILPTNDEASILASMDALGGRTSWGVSPGANRWLVDPGIFIEKLLPDVLTMLNEAMANTPVERLSHVTLTAADNQPPAPDPSLGGLDTFGELTRLSIRWQLGM